MECYKFVIDKIPAQTCPHMSMSQCGNICIMPPKCVRKERLCGFSNRSSVDAGSHVRETLCVSMRTLEIMVKLRTLLTVCTLFWKLKLAIMERGVTFPTRARGVRPITMHCASWPIKADCACRKEGLCKKHLRAAGLRGTIIMYSIWKRMYFFYIKACQHILLHQIDKIMIFKKKASYWPL